MNNKYIIKGIILLGVASSIGFSSCQITNKYKSPEYDSQNLYRDEEPTDTTTIANIPWREYFSDPILQALIEEGIDNNYDLQMAYSRIKQAEVNLSIARAAYFPNIALVGQWQQNRTSIDASGVKDVLGYSTNAYGVGIAVTWEADIWGKLNRQSRASYAQFLASQSYKNLIQTSLVANIATSYYSLLALDEQLKITKETIGLLKESVSTMEALKEAGIPGVNGAAVEQSKALLYGTSAAVPDLESQIYQLGNTLCVLLGRKPASIARSVMDVQQVPLELKHGVPMQMLAMRPDVQQAELAFRSAFELTVAAKASLLPSITLNTGTQVGFIQNFKPENLIANIIAGITQPIFAKKQLIGQLNIRKAQQEEALLNFEKTVLTAGSEVSNILYAYESSLNKNEDRQKQINSLNTAVYFTQELLKAGEANYIEVLNAEQSLLQAQLNQVGDKLQQLQASVNLYRALGGGLK
jgi:NodT family efflux transporter outer membrane factor (OMF) lipoprotein